MQSRPAQAAIKLNREGKFQEALALVAPLVEKGDKQPNAYLQMSRALRGMKDDKAAREVEQRALELFPDNPRVAAHVGNLFASADKEYAKAAEIVGPHLAAGRIEPDLVAVASIALRSLKRDSEADAIELKGLAQNPNNVQLLVRRAIALNRSSKFADVISLLAGKETIVEGNATLKTHLQRAREGLATGKAAPAQSSATTAGAAQPAAPAPEKSAVATAAVAGHAPATVPAARTATMAAPAESAKEAQKPTAQSVPASAVARPATPPAPSPPHAQSAIASPQSTPRSAALGSIPTVPAPAAQATRPQPAPSVPSASSAPPAPAPRAPEVQSSAPKYVPTTTSVPAGAATAATARTSAPVHPTMTAAASRQQPSAPAHQSAAYSAAKPRSGISAFAVIFWGLVIVAAGLLGAHFAELIDLAPFAQQVSAMIEAARGN